MTDALPGYFGPEVHDDRGGLDLLTRSIDEPTDDLARPPVLSVAPAASVPSSLHWDDAAVRRILHTPLAESLGCLRALPAVPVGLRWLDQSRGGDSFLADAHLTLRWRLRPVPVTVTVRPWSSTRCELRVQRRPRRRLVEPSQGFFDAAHAAVDDLQAMIEAMVPTRIG